MGFGEKTVLMTVPEVAEALRCSPQTVRTMCREKRLPSVRVRGSWRVNRAAFERLVSGERPHSA